MAQIGYVSGVLIDLGIGLIQLITCYRLCRTCLHFAIGQIGNAYSTRRIRTAQGDVVFIGCVIHNRQTAQQTRFIFGFFDVLLHFLLNIVEL